jgi:acetyl-CoA acetyltransferase family protein
MKELHIIAATRTPFCRMGTSLAGLDAVELGRAAVSGLLTQSGIDPMLVDETILGCVGQPADAQNIARVIALRAGIPESKPAMTVHRNCASGLESLLTAHQRLNTGMGEVFIVGGVESMSNMPLHFPRSAMLKFAALSKARGAGGKLSAISAFRPADFIPLIALKMGLTDPVSEMNMGETAEVLAREFGISREAQDAFAMRSHLRATQAAWAMQREITPVLLDGKVIATDNGIRSDSSMEKLGKLPVLFDPKHGSVTAGNSSQITDGAVALLVAGEEAMRRNGWKSLGKIKSYAVTGCDPARMGLGPVRAIHDVLHRSGARLDDFDVIEINEAFAAQTLAVLRCLRDPTSARRAGLDEPLGVIEESRLNPCGGAIALGHPVGATGARLVLTALRQLHDTDKHRALVSLCVGGGQGVAVILEGP